MTRTINTDTLSEKNKKKTVYLYNVTGCVFGEVETDILRMLFVDSPKINY
jgi:hypothetical protein